LDGEGDTKLLKTCDDIAFIWYDKALSMIATILVKKGESLRLVKVCEHRKQGIQDMGMISKLNN
jgi:hypothetical protein